MPNRVIGEIEIKLGGKTYTLKPSFQSIAEIEDRSGLGIAALASKISKGNIGLKDAAALIYGGLIGSGETSLRFEEVGEMIRREGPIKFFGIASEFLASCLKGDEEDQKAVKEGKSQAEQSK